MSKGDMDSDIPKTTSAEKMCAACGRIRNQRQTLPENSLFCRMKKQKSTGRTGKPVQVKMEYCHMKFYISYKEYEIIQKMI